jgi:lipoate-protein ligase B
MSYLGCIDLGSIAYSPALEIQQTLLSRVQTDPQQAYLLTCQHDPPAITLGRRGCDSEILVSRGELARNHVEIHHIQRGGQVTVHPPGQLVAYAILSLRSRGLALREHVCNLEETIVRTLSCFGVTARRLEDQVGGFVGDRKIASIGIAVSRWVTYHGLSLNVDQDLGCFDWIVPCGQKSAQVTSVSKLAGEVTVWQVARDFVECFAEVFAFDDVRRIQLPEHE